MTDPTGPSVLVEIIALRVMVASEEPALAYRRRTAMLYAPDTPDSLARRLAGLAEDVTGVVVHSTSWRYLPTGELVLTYLICPDSEPATDAVPLLHPQLAYATGPAHPTPPVIHLDHVASHAARHLAWLGHTDPLIAATLNAHPALLAALRPLVPGLGGQYCNSIASELDMQGTWSEPPAAMALTGTPSAREGDADRHSGDTSSTVLPPQDHSRAAAGVQRS